MDKNGSIGTRHGEMKDLVRNPFRSPYMRQNFDAAIETYDAKHKDLIRESGVRCNGNSWAHHFWNGFDLVGSDYTGIKDSAAHAMFRAGKAIREALEK